MDDAPGAACCGASVACALVTRTRFLEVAAIPTLAMMLVLSSCSSGDDSATASRRSDDRPSSDERRSTEQPTGTDVAWGSCTQQMAVLASLECGRLDVPLDPMDPEGDTTELALARFPSTGTTAERIGSLVLNPGGPGGSGIDFLAGATQMMPAAITDRFDLVSFDPRGVGESSPVTCVDDQVKADSLIGDLTPDSPEEIDAAVRQQAELLEGCRDQSPELLEHMSTADVAADLDRVRAAIGDEQLTYLGYSYGTAIGAVYATMFPERTRALVLDGSVSPVESGEATTVAQAQGFDQTYARFVEACNVAADCPLGPDAGATIAATRARLADQPVESSGAAGTRALGVDQFDLALATALYDTSLWGTTARAIADVDGSGADVLWSLVDRQTGRQPDGTFDNSTEARTMVNCADTTERPTVDEAAAAAERIRAAAPTFGPALGWAELSCVGWPLAANPVPPLTGAGAPPILVVGTLGDPATPYVWSEQMTDALESAVLLTYEGAGHTAFLRGGQCIEDAVVAYLVDLEVPEPGTSCPAQADQVSFGGLQDQVVQQFTDSGIPEEIARCVVGGIIDDIGEAEFDLMILSNDAGQLSKLVTAQTIACATGQGSAPPTSAGG